MARRRPAQRPARGGDGIQASRPTRARVGLGALSAVAYGGTLAYAVSLAADFGPLVGLIGAVGAVLLAFVLVRGNDDLLAWSLGTLGTAYAVALEVGRHSLDEGAPLVAGALLLCGELAAWSLEGRSRIPAEPGAVRLRALALAGLVVGGLAAATAVVAVGAAPSAHGPLWTLGGAAAAVGIVALAVRRSGRRQTG